MKLLRTLVLAPVLLASAASAQIVNLVATDAGWYDSFGFHNTANQSYITGQGFDLTRSFFVFDLPAIDGTVTAASLRVFNPAFGFDSQDASENISFFAVDTSIASLTGGTADVAGFDDLGDGTVFGGGTISASSNGQWLTFNFNSSFLAALGGNPAQIAIGGALTSLDPLNFSFNETVFGFSDAAANAPTLELTVTPIPEPISSTILGVVALGAGVMLRRRRQAGARATA